MQVNYSVQFNGYSATHFLDYGSVYMRHGTGEFGHAGNQFYSENQINDHGEWVVPQGKEVIFIGGRGSIADFLKGMGPLKFMFPTALGAGAMCKYFKSGNLLKDNLTVLVVAKGNALPPKGFQRIGMTDIVFASQLSTFEGTSGQGIDPKFSCMHAEELSKAVRSMK